MTRPVINLLNLGNNVPSCGDLDEAKPGADETVERVANTGPAGEALAGRLRDTERSARIATRRARALSRAGRIVRSNSRKAATRKQRVRLVCPNSVGEPFRR